MKNIFFLFLFLQTAFLSAQSTYKSSSDLLIKNVSVISMKTNEVLRNQDVLIVKGKISLIGKTKNSKNKNVAVLNGTGKFIMPSLSDAHVHFPETELAMEQVLKMNLINGVTKLRSMRGDWKHVEWRKKFNSENSYYPKLYISPPPILRTYDLTVDQLTSFVKATKENGFDFIKILSLKNEKFFTQLDSLSKKYKIGIGGHYPSLSEGKQLSNEQVFNSNYKSFEHLGGLFGQSEEEIVKRISLLKDNNLAICPTLSWYNIGSGKHSADEYRKLRGMEFVPKSQLELWISETLKYREKIGVEAYNKEVVSEMKSLDQKYRIIKKLNDAGVNMILSPDASSKYMTAGFNVLEEMLLLKNADLSNFSILKMDTVNFATFLNEDYGTIEVGKNADFIVLGNNPLDDLNALTDVQGVFYNNHFIGEKELKSIKIELLSTVSE